MSYKSRLNDVVHNINLVIEHRESFEKNELGKYGIERALMITGEAMRVLKDKYGVNWEEHHEMIKMSDFIDHNYTSIDYGIIINTIDYELPGLLKFTRKLLEEQN